MANDDVADNSAEKNKVLKNIYYNISSPGSLSGWKKLRDEVEKSVKNVTKDEIMNFLLSQPTYSIFKKRVQKYPVRKVLRKSPFETITADLMDMQALSAYNSNLKWICVVVDIFSNYVYLRGLKQKTSVEMKACMADFFKTVPPPYHKKTRFLWSDAGTEFTSIKDWLAELDPPVKLYHVKTGRKACMAERMVRTVKTKL